MVALIVAAFSSVPIAAQAQDQVISIDPQAAPAGWAVTVTGTGWDPKYGPVSIYSSFDDIESSTPTPLAPPSPTPDDTEAFSTTILVPSLTPGDYTFVACQECPNSDSFPYAEYRFTVEATAPATLSLSPSNGAPRSDVTAVGTGWNPLDGRVSIFPDQSDVSSPDAALVSATPDATGTFKVPVVAPDAPHPYVFFACQRCGAEPAESQTADFTVVVSTQRPPALVVVPDLVGLDATRAEQLTAALGLALAVTWQGRGDERGVIRSQVPHAGTRVPPGARLHATAERTPAPAPLSQRSRAAVGVATVLLIAALVATIVAWRLRRPQRWVQRRIRIEPHPDPVPAVAQNRIGDAPDHAVRVEPHRDPGVQTLEEVGS